MRQLKKIIFKFRKDQRKLHTEIIRQTKEKNKNTKVFCRKISDGKRGI